MQLCSRLCVATVGHRLLRRHQLQVRKRAQGSTRLVLGRRNPLDRPQQVQWLSPVDRTGRRARRPRHLRT